LVQKLLLETLVANQRLIRIAVWVLAVILPGGLAVLALWASVRAVRSRLLVRTDTPALQLPSSSTPT
jgi:hypothetical protein